MLIDNFVVYTSQIRLFSMDMVERSVEGIVYPVSSPSYGTRLYVTLVEITCLLCRSYLYILCHL